MFAALAVIAATHVRRGERKRGNPVFAALLWIASLATTGKDYDDQFFANSP